MELSLQKRRDYCTTSSFGRAGDLIKLPHLVQCHLAYVGRHFTEVDVSVCELDRLHERWLLDMRLRWIGQNEAEMHAPAASIRGKSGKKKKKKKTKKNCRYAIKIK